MAPAIWIRALASASLSFCWVALSVGFANASFTNACITNEYLSDGRWWGCILVLLAQISRGRLRMLKLKFSLEDPETKLLSIR